MAIILIWQDLCVEKDAIMRVAMKLFHYLYEMELLAEDIIVAWHSKKAEDARRQKCRKVVRDFHTHVYLFII